MISQKYSWGRLILGGVERGIRDMAKTLPGTVVSYDEDAETCSVRVSVHKLVPSAEDRSVDLIEEVPVLHHVPVAWPRARGFSLVGTLGAGDPVLLVACDRNISGWRRAGAPSEPDNSLTHSWDDAIAIPGVQADQGGFDEPSDAAALASLLDNFGQTVAALADPTTPATALTAIIGILNAARAVWGGPLAAPPVPLASVASTILKLEE